MRDWLAEARALRQTYETGADACRYVDEKDNKDETAPFVLNVHSVHPPLHQIELPPPAAEKAPRPARTAFADGELGEWQRRLFVLRTDEAPCPGFRHWPSVQSAAMAFLRDRGEEAVRLGWGVLDLFGVHDTAGAVRVDCTGALITLRGKRVAELTPDLIRFADGLAYRRRSLSAGLTVPVWNFGDAR